MTHREIIDAIVAASKANRGYASEFGWATDRDVEEWGVVARALARTLDMRGELFFDDVIARGRGNDPPDCEGVTETGDRIAFEVTELVDGKAIQYAKHHNTRFAWAEWPEEKFTKKLGELIASKAKRHAHLKGGPYPGGYVIVVYTAEPNLTSAVVTSHLKSFKMPELPERTMAYLILGYTTKEECNPCFKLA